MYKYAMATKIDNSMYEVFNTIIVPENSIKTIERVENAINSGQSIIGIKTTQFGNKVKWNATWDGQDIINSDLDEEHPGIVNANWEVMDSFSFICNSKIFLIVTTVNNTVGHDMYNAAFTNEVTLVKVNDGEDVSVGDLWDTEKFIKAS